MDGQIKTSAITYSSTIVSDNEAGTGNAAVLARIL